MINEIEIAIDDHPGIVANVVPGFPIPIMVRASFQGSPIAAGYLRNHAVPISKRTSKVSGKIAATITVKP
jgi:hypothetical protein